ncbi:MAG: glycoside hydrolase [Spirochaetaceae bacterium]|nr:glycoside hydrolase [Spirochaetaceae bacterium]
MVVVVITNCKSAPPAGDGLQTESPADVSEEFLEDDEIPAEEIAYEAFDHDENLPENAFSEVWAYMLNGREKDLKRQYPVSDVVHFAAEVDRYGQLADIPRRKSISGFNGRVHLAVICNSAGLTHFVIQSGTEARKRLVSEILAAAKEYDGLNIDLESVPARDAEHFLSFLAELRAGLGGRMLSVCVPGRTRADGVYSYTSISALVDRVFVMAYDEHWSGSAPGPVASMKWCAAVAEYGLHAIGPEKLIMGIPFYGRGWGDKSTSRALIHSTTEGLKRDYNVQDFRRENGIPVFTYDITVKVTVYYEDEYSLAARMSMYRGRGVQNIGFWRLGQETPKVWQLIKLDGR